VSVLVHRLVGKPTFRTHLGLGIAYGYPLCCALRFALGKGAQATRRGCVDHRYVPCGIFHRARA
jgi:hypothetical protein